MTDFSNVVSVDFETYYDSECSVVTLGPEMYTRHPKFNVYMISVCDGEETWVGHPDDFAWESLDGKILVSHNAAFDQMMYESLVRDNKAPRIQPLAWHCTANMSAYLTNRRALGEVIKFLYNTDISKDMRAWMKGHTWEEAKALGKGDEMLEYARRDAFHCWKLWADYSDKWPEAERRLSAMTIRGGRHGVHINAELLNEYTLKLQTELIKIESSLPWAAAGAPPTSPKAIANECRKEGIPCPPVKSHDGGEEDFIEWELTYGQRYAWVRNVGNWRSVNKVLASMLTIKSRIRPDGTMESLTKFFGAHTGRWSGEGGLNFQNFRKVPLLWNEQNDLEIDEARIKAAVKHKEKNGAWPEWVTFELDIRRLICPRPGKKFIICDLAQIEPRVLAWLTGNTQLMDLMRGGMSIYEAFARTNLGWTGGVLKKEDPGYYKLVKIQVLGLGYGCGWEKFITIAAKDDVELDEAKSKGIVEGFRAANPLITGFWKTLDSAFKRSVGEKIFVMKLPSGREMTYRKVCVRVTIKTNPDTGLVDKERSYCAEVTKGGRPVVGKLYGGLLTENLVQAIARDVFAAHLLELDEQGYVIPFTVHDEAVLEVDLDVDPKLIEGIMGTTPEWLEGCPVGAEAMEAGYYKK